MYGTWEAVRVRGRAKGRTKKENAFSLGKKRPLVVCGRKKRKKIKKTPCAVAKVGYNRSCQLEVSDKQSLNRKRITFAGVAQLAEHNVANVVVEGSNPFARSLETFDCCF